MAKPRKSIKARRRAPGRNQAVPAQATAPPTPLPSARVLRYSLRRADHTFDYTEKEEDTLFDSSKSSGSHLQEKLRYHSRSLVVSTLHKLPPEVRVMIYTLCMDMKTHLDERKLVLRQITPPMLVSLRPDLVLYQEALAVYYDVNTLLLAYDTFHPVTTNLLKKAVSMIKNVRIEIYSPMFDKYRQPTGSFYIFLNSQKNGKRTAIWRFLQSHEKLTKISSHQFKHESDTDLAMVEEVIYLLTQAGTTVYCPDRGAPHYPRINGRKMHIVEWEAKKGTFLNLDWKDGEGKEFVKGKA